MSGAVLRPANPTDAGALAAVHRAARRAAMPYLPELHGEAEDRDWISETVLPSATVWVAEVDGRPVGYLALTGSSLDQLYVAPGYQGRGIGSQLLDKAKALSPVRLRLYAFQSNHRARAFYEARGFTAAAFSDGADNEEQEPDVMYEWAVRPGQSI
jgi:ribosomal protein S18 acetylase RimI-like enzyme